MTCETVLKLEITVNVNTTLSRSANGIVQSDANLEEGNIRKRYHF